MDVSTTLAIIAAFIGLSVFAGWRGSLPPDLAKGVRMIPWRPIMVFSAAGVLFLLVHLASLFGIQTGR
ncbi:MAG: hypothetical protein Q8L66_14335 [Caulobacter sp.]|nr:hypothetical protein [Caulobacter sp.]